MHKKGGLSPPFSFTKKIKGTTTHRAQSKIFYLKTFFA